MNDDTIDLDLTDEQWDKVKSLWNSRPKDNPPTLLELAQSAFDSSVKDLNSPECLTVRKRLAEYQSGKSKKTVALNDDQKEYIKNNLDTMNSIELAKMVFKKKNLIATSKECQLVDEYVKLLAPDSNQDKDDGITTANYRPPKSIERVINKINYYRNEKLDSDKLTGRQKKDCLALINYINTYRFVHQINIYEKTTDRELFESTFIRCCWNKHDLTEEEVDEYILYSTEVVLDSSISIRVETLRRQMDDASSGDDDKQITIKLVEAINSAQTEHDQCIKRQAKLLDSLKVKRKDKEGKSNEGIANLLNLFQLFKEEESRKKMVSLAKIRKEKLKVGVEELDQMDALKALICGISKEEIVNG